VYQFDIGRKQILEAEAVDRMGVPAAHFHHAVVPGGIGQAADLLGRFGDQFGLTEFIDVFHWSSAL
jgi:hypothetical protein